MEKYYANKENVLDILNKYGVAIIPNVLSLDECDKMENDMWNYLEHISQEWEDPIIRDDTSTYAQISKLYYDYENIALLINFWLISHSELCWKARENTKIVEIFANIWSVKQDELLVSFDGASIQLPPEITGFGFGNSKWFHTDQSYISSDLKYIQSWITAFDVNDGDATLSILEKSNLFHKEFSENYEISKTKNYSQLNKEQIEFYKNKGCKEVKITCPKGSLVLWDGRTIHYGVEASAHRVKPNIRCVVYLCYLPRSFSDEENLEKKIYAYNNLLATPHDPCKIVTLPMTPYADIDITNISMFIKPLKKYKLSKLGEKLAGFTDIAN
jgi:ectoine hydroxylase-related dioxygenase (phytanoyl-CoA dioxygenase family)